MPSDSLSQPYKYSPHFQRERSGCLNLWLIASIAFTLFAGFLIVQILNTLASRPEITVPDNTWINILLFSAIIVSTLVFLRAIVLWRKWGVYGMVVVSIVSPFIKQGLMMVSIWDWIAPFIQIGLLLFLVSSSWDNFE
jgi:presenilin-like A22 family membrane protease